MSAQENYIPLPLRSHTILGVCEAIGEDFGFSPVVEPDNRDWHLLRAWRRGARVALTSPESEAELSRAAGLRWKY